MRDKRTDTTLQKIKLVFLATPDIALNTFKFFINSPDYELQALVTQPSKACPRGKKILENNLKKLAKQTGVAVFEPEKISKDDFVLEKLKGLNADFFITFAYGQILSQKVLNIPKIAVINLHASLLPKYRGANPICEVLLNGEDKTGITTMVTALELDAGDICLQKEIRLSNDTNILELTETIAKESPEILDKTLKGLFLGELKPCPQNQEAATFTVKRKKSDKEIIWSESAKVLHNKVRAFCGINTLHTKFNGKIIQILKTHVCDGITGKCGEVIAVTKDGIEVSCGSGNLIIEIVKPEGKAQMGAFSWSLGSRIKKGDLFL